MAKNRTMAVKHAKVRKLSALENIRKGLDMPIAQGEKYVQHPSLCTPKRPAAHKTFAKKIEREFSLEYESYFDEVRYISQNQNVTILGVTMSKTIAEVLTKVNPGVII